MSVEHWGKSNEVNRENLGERAETGFILANTLEDASGPMASEKIIGSSDQNTREELILALRMMVARVGIPEGALAELEGNEEAMNRVNVLAGKYVVAVKALDLKEQNRLAKELQRILG